ncbi:hypothetical protein [Kiloniella sp.]|uniref:hypothetical protein n=1 Tax=Kiloniella sp. TaxID=1938587 RepID=UPI003B018E61
MSVACIRGVRGGALIGLVLLTQGITSLASACPGDESGYMPICGGLTTVPDTDVVVIESSQSKSRSNILLGPKEYSADHVKIVIGNVERPLTIVVSHYEAAILHFSGNVDKIAKVVAMGARIQGWDHVAVTGIDARKVTFLPVIGKNQDLKTTCSAPPKACVPQQYFKLGKWWQRWFSHLPLDPWVFRTSPAMHIKVLRGGTIFIPPQPETETVTATATENSFSSGWRGEVERYRAETHARAIFEQDQLLSPTTIELDPNLPSWEGIANLVKKGQIRPAGDYATDPDLINFSEKFSAKYRSRFDPDFSFKPRIDFVLTPSFRGPIPRDLEHSQWRPVTFLSRYLDRQERRKGDKGDYCFYSENDPLLLPEGSSSKGIGWERRQPMCRSVRPLLASSEKKTDRLARLQLNAALDLRNHRKWGTKLCPLLDIPKEAEIVVLSTQNGRRGEGIAFKHCGIKKSHHSVGSGLAGEVTNGVVGQCNVGQVNVKVDREGPVFLFLKASSALNWNLDVSNASQISGVASIGDRRQMVTGLPEGVPYSQYVPGDRELPDSCRNGLVYAHPLVGGPAIQLFEMMFKKVSGSRIDVLMNKGMSPEQEDQTPEVVNNYTNFVVE